LLLNGHLLKILILSICMTLILWLLVFVHFRTLSEFLMKLLPV
jgi:hypothetical protein